MKKFVWETVNIVDALYTPVRYGDLNKMVDNIEKVANTIQCLRHNYDKLKKYGVKITVDGTNQKYAVEIYTSFDTIVISCDDEAVQGMETLDALDYLETKLLSHMARLEEFKKELSSCLTDVYTDHED